MILTREIFKQGLSSNNGLNNQQVQALGITEMRKGWAKTIIGKDIPAENIKLFLELKDAHFKRKIMNGGTLKRKIAAKMNLISFAPVFEKIPYAEQYLHPNWQKLRLYIFERDKYTCVNCRSIDKQLHAHHMKYLRDKFIWEVPTWYLVTLCEDCHSKEHGKDLTAQKTY